jgi:AbrB family looped-hinge helix DNA binding protein
MKTAFVSERGQVTLPAAARRKLGIQPSSQIEIEVREKEIVLRPMRTIADVAGAFHKYTIGKTTDWETIREETMRIVAEEVAHEGL